MCPWGSSGLSYGPNLTKTCQCLLERISLHQPSTYLISTQPVGQRNHCGALGVENTIQQIQLMVTKLYVLVLNLVGMKLVHQWHLPWQIRFLQFKEGQETSIIYEYVKDKPQLRLTKQSKICACVSVVMIRWCAFKLSEPSCITWGTNNYTSQEFWDFSVPNSFIYNSQNNIILL